jgi:hypothetical protein
MPDLNQIKIDFFNSSRHLVFFGKLFWLWFTLPKNHLTDYFDRPLFDRKICWFNAISPNAV